MTITEAERKQVLDAFGKVSDTVVGTMVELASRHHQPIDDLYVLWELFAMLTLASSSKEDEFCAANLDRFQEYLQQTATKATPHNRKRVLQLGFSSSPVAHTPKRAATTPYKTPRATFTSSPAAYDTADLLFNAGYLSPTRKSQAPESHLVVETLNHAVPPIDLAALDPLLARLAANYEPQKYKFRTMAMKVLELADYLDDQIDTFAELYLELKGMLTSKENKSSEFGNPCIPSQLDVVCCGRVVPDSLAYDAGSSLNELSLCLETLRMLGIGQRVPLDIGQLPLYLFFPGQIVVLRGRNPSGRCFIVSEVLEVPKLGLPISLGEELVLFAETAPEGVKVVVALGPFSNGHTLNYSKFAQFIDHVNRVAQPQVLLLNGPFVDVTHPVVKLGDYVAASDEKAPVSDDAIFKQAFAPILKQVDPAIQVILVPSLLDANIKHVSYPQDLFDRKKFGLPKNCKVMPNPANFSINEMVVGNLTLDVFKDLTEIQRNAGSNRFERVVGHVLDQRRFYPLVPGAVAKQKPAADNLEGGAHGDKLATIEVGGSCLELPYMGLTELGALVPDLMVLPLKLTPFAKVVNGVVAVNPGQFIRHFSDPQKESGNYAVLLIEPPSVETNLDPVPGNEGMYYHNVYKRCRVDICKS